MPLLNSSAPVAREAGAQPASVLHDVREGIDTVLRSPVLWISILVFAISNITLAGP